MKEQVRKLVNDLTDSSSPWDMKVSAADEIAIKLGLEAGETLFPLLKDTDPDVRNAVALALRDLKDDRAIPPLLNAILDPANKNNCGTLAYALETLNCSQYFGKSIKLITSKNFEVRLT